jgi:hypothetical protein
MGPLSQRALAGRGKSLLPGQLPSVTVAVRPRPPRVNMISTVSPGRLPWSRQVSSRVFIVAWPFTPTMMSWRLKPADAAGPGVSTPVT